MNELNNLSCFEIEGGCIDLKSFPEQNLLPSSLNSLRISRLSNLEFLDYKGLEHLTSLETLKINGCDKLQSFPEEGLPSSVTYLYINGCSLLNAKFQNRRGKEWYKIAHITHIQIDEEVISTSKLRKRSCLELDEREDAHLTFFFEHHWMLVAVTALSTEPGEDWPKISQFANKVINGKVK
ncbi:hypothetical protein Q3G72_019766 [Acer saccharum]|nr:hypothetical protein Q3G72_019766 [Acer saccharum]